eukprot:gnl/Ergobibamus_cyprinoides/3792.p1 GENE.gnl/Ergobibamus_cyprinoides/3792~~gnl/Ergobibamus_cyprinoides/3792.p1  ORF type:complete len:103 (+),score=7.00 gnl/Ergobibamus_cyprinoides/3792:337-645(+)
MPSPRSLQEATASSRPSEFCNASCLCLDRNSATVHPMNVSMSLPSILHTASAVAAEFATPPLTLPPMDHILARAGGKSTKSGKKGKKGKKRQEGQEREKGKK